MLLYICDIKLLYSDRPPPRSSATATSTAATSTTSIIASTTVVAADESPSDSPIRRRHRSYTYRSYLALYYILFSSIIHLSGPAHYIVAIALQSQQSLRQHHQYSQHHICSCPARNSRSPPLHLVAIVSARISSCTHFIYPTVVALDALRSTITILYYCTDCKE